MSFLIKTKNKKKKKKNEEVEYNIKPQKHKKVGNLNVYSEETSLNIIDKIISLVISSEFGIKVEKKLGDFCFESMKRMIENIMQIYNLVHDKDDFDIDNIEINTFIKMNKSDKDINRYLIKNHNNAIESRNDKAEINITQIARIAKDFKAYNNIKSTKKEECLNKSVIIEKNKYLKKEKIIQYDIDFKKNNFWGDIPCPQISDIDRTSSNFNSYIPINKKSKKNSPKSSSRKTKKGKKDNKLNKRPSFNYKTFISRITQKLSSSKLEKENNNEFFKKKPSRIQIINLPSYPLGNIEQKKESEEIINLRKEKLEEIIQKKEELKKKQLEELQKKKEEEEKKAKKSKKGKYTFDNEGNLILINEIKQDKLLKEFLPINIKQKEIKQGKTLDFYKKETIQMENEAKKNIEYNYIVNDNIYSSFLPKSRLTEPFINFNEFKKNSYSIQSQLKFKKNINGSFFDFFKKVEPSGSNFSLINPSVGVKVTEKKNTKDGGYNYFKEYKKYSIDEFNKTLQETFELSKFIPKSKSQIDIFKATTPNGEINRLKKSIFSKNFNVSDISKNKELNNLNNIIKLEKNNQRANRNLKIKNRDKIFGQTFSSKFKSNQENKKSFLMNSTSEIILADKKFINLKEFLFQEEPDKKKYIKLPNQRQSKENTKIFNQNIINKTMWRDKKFDKYNTIFSDIDKLNKNIIIGKDIKEKSFFNNKMILPKISLRNNETNFNRTMMNFNRERIKKNMIENIPQKKEKIQNIKKIRKIKSVKIKE